ncbi:MAG: VWA-like domain-containing protein [Thermofilaceae archaeon]
MSEEIQIHALRAAIRDSIAAVLVKDFTAGLLLRSFPIYYDEEGEAAAYTDGKAIYVGKRFLELPPPWKAFALLHELGHIVSLHIKRTKTEIGRRGLPPALAMPLANVAADLVTDLQLLPSSLVPRERREELEEVVETLGLPDPTSSSFEEIFAALLKAKKLDIQHTATSVPVATPAGHGSCNVPAAGAQGQQAPQQGGGSMQGGGSAATPSQQGGGESESKSGESVPSYGSGQGEGGASPREEARKEDEKEGGGTTPSREGVEKKEGSGNREQGESAETPSQAGGGEGGAASRREGGLPRVGERDLVETPSPRRKVVQEGEGEPADEKEILRRVAAAVNAARMAGRDPGGWERLVATLLKPAVDWRKLLRFYLQKGLGRGVKRTWFRPSRKCPELRPGREALRLPRVFTLVDTSGSISEGELQRFVSEVYAIARESAEVVVIPWDATAYDPIVIRRPADVKRVKLTGGGGTHIAPAIEKVEKMARPTDLFVILSDWEIADIESFFVQEWLKKNARRIIAATVEKEPPPWLRTVRLPRDEL